jgi:nucleotide-binding universal stress UspA family protein
MRILCPVDINDVQEKVLNFAAFYTNQSHSELTLVYATMDAPLDGGVEIEAKMKVIAQGLESNNAGLNVKHTWLNGLPISAIRDAVTKLNAQLLIMGTKADKRVNFQGIHIGSSTLSVIDEVKVPAFVIPLTEDLTHIKHVVFGIDATRINESAIKAAHSLLVSAAPKATFVFVSTKSEEKADAAFDKVKPALETCWPGCAFETIEGDDLVEALQDFVDAHEGDLLIVNKYKPTFFDKLFSLSSTKKLAYHAHLPMLVVQA